MVIITETSQAPWGDIGRVALMCHLFAIMEIESKAGLAQTVRELREVQLRVRLMVPDKDNERH
jgi:hypothetical protein